MCGSVWSILLLLFGLLFSASASNQRRSYRTAASVRDRYDRSVTTFDPSGRLLQVEYAQQAAHKRALRLVMTVVNDVCYIVTTSKAESSLSPRATLLHRISDRIYLVAVGLLGDIRAAASHLRLQAQQHRFNYDEEWTVEQAATALSNLQHQLTHQSGVRPLGITGFLLGTDAPPYRSATAPINNATAPWPMAQLFQCSPGGLPEDCLYCCTGSQEAQLLSVLQEQYPQFQNRTEADIVQDLVAMVHSTGVVDERDAPKDDPMLDVWVLRRPRSSRPPVSCFQHLRNTAGSFAKLHEYYNRPAASEPAQGKRD
jgi:20S proteasome alpha/beta subunit